MAEKKSGVLSKIKLLEKLKKVKHIEIIAVAVLAVLIMLVWFIDWGSTSNKTNNQVVSSSNSVTDYAKELERRLEEALSDIDGAGKITVMITLDGAKEVILASSTDEKKSSTTTTSSGGTINDTETLTSNSEPIIITENGTSSPIILKEIMPPIKGVVVIAEGAGNVRVKLDLLKAVQALLSVSSNQVEIFKGNN
ncbi:MAG: hypothetical protein IJZ26_02835 [Clostridia bacterium]|nr:hypothetical protein [Clostridia bacterium]